MHAATRTTLGTALVAALTALTLPSATAAAPAPGPRTEKVSVATGGAEADQGATGLSISRDGRYVVFASAAANLVPGDTNNASDIFLRDLTQGTTVRVSTRADGSQADGPSTDPTISADGSHIGFSSDAANLAPGATGGRTHGYVKNLRTGAVERVNDAVAPGYDTSSGVQLSADGRYAAFQAARSEYSYEPDQHSRAYRLDRTTGKTVRVSAPSTAQVQRAVKSLSISGDGKRVAYQFFSPHPAQGDWSDIHVRDVPTGKLYEADKPPAGATSDGQSEDAQLSADGRHVVFHSLDSRLTPGDTNKAHNVHIRDLTTNAVRRIDAASKADHTSAGALSADGRYLAFNTSTAGDTSYVGRVQLRDLKTGATRLISANTAGAPSKDGAYGSAISGDGTRVVFGSYSSDLVPGDTYDSTHVYVRHTG
ncbi:hypothetical protein OG897_21440 [Streptomyces sp. NBC_00237]|uniref:TolB family protein n=1 Tax=Streptomyces sp. NBC_00237 TaxID=2975687 RepID=UPI00225888AC|nr:hypothetical protein [Streptomyces sp. NBC_00237]MCX5204002.1 hypothetical protein [Streptomyces sp. NBC_00237]